MHRDAQQHCQSYDVCQQIKNLLHTPMAKLITMLLVEPFMKWGFDFIGPIKSMSHSHDNKYILVAYQLYNKVGGGKSIKDQHDYNHNSIHL
jgi:hypothetical protein